MFSLWNFNFNLIKLQEISELINSLLRVSCRDEYIRGICKRVSNWKKSTFDFAPGYRMYCFLFHRRAICLHNTTSFVPCPFPTSFVFDLCTTVVSLEKSISGHAAIFCLSFVLNPFPTKQPNRRQVLCS